MEKKWKKWVEQIGLSKLLIIFLAGIFLLILSLPGSDSSSSLSLKGDSDGEKQDAIETGNEQDTAWEAMSEYASRLEKELEQVLSQVEGVGQVDVMLTIAASEEKKTLVKESSSREEIKEQESTGGSRKQSTQNNETDPVLVEEGEEQTPYVIKVSSPEIEGVLVVAQGAGNGSVDSEIIAAVEALFPVEAHKIKVMKKE
jgi:stage III sporulation protein AG